MVGIDVGVLSHLKEELAWTEDKRLWIVSTVMLFKNSKTTTTKELKGTISFKFKTILYTLLCGP